ncbi:Dabb family protein [Ulvibacterium sp.]|uniref:Dabb family protein n=1 Tax=Ulvibacterium sp. TaxID=2665914 RepID=UPI003BAB4EE6
MEQLFSKAFTTTILWVSLYIFLAIHPGFSQTITEDYDRSATLQPVDVAEIHGNTVTATVYGKNGEHFVYAGGDSGFIDVLHMASNGDLTAVETIELYNKNGPARGLVADNIEGTDYLFVGNKGGNAVEVFRIGNDGRLKRVFLLKDTDQTYLGTVITLKVVHMEKKSFLFVGGLEDTPGLSCFEIRDTGKLVHVQSMKDNEAIHTDGIIGMYSHKINGDTFLFTGGFQDNGVSSFRVFENGHFENVNNIADNTKDRYLTGAYPVDGVVLGGNPYVVVGHRHHKYYKRVGFIKKKDFVYHGDGVSIFKVSPKGELIPHFVLIDDERTKLSGQTRIELLQLNEEQAIVSVATRDDKSIQICHLDQDGKLSPLGVLDTGYPIYYGMASQKIGEDLFFLAGSVQNDIKKLFSYKINFWKNHGDKSPRRVLRHIVNLKYKAEATEGQIDEAIAGFKDLQTKIPEIIGFEGGYNISKEGHSQGFTHSFVLSFKNEKDRDIYLSHEAHKALVEKVGPILEDVLVMDYWGKNAF